MEPLSCKMYTLACWARIEGSDQPMHPWSLIRVFNCGFDGYPRVRRSFWRKTKTTQTVRMRILITQSHLVPYPGYGLNYQICKKDMTLRAPEKKMHLKINKSENVVC